MRYSEINEGTIKDYIIKRYLAVHRDKKSTIVYLMKQARAENWLYIAFLVNMLRNKGHTWSELDAFEKSARFELTKAKVRYPQINEEHDFARMRTEPGFFLIHSNLYISKKNPQKQRVIQHMIRQAKEGLWIQLSFLINNLRERGYTWPELDTFEKSARKELDATGTDYNSMADIRHMLGRPGER